MEHLSTFGLTRDPFANEPQLDLFYESRATDELNARLRRAAQQGKGLVVLTGPGGVGKTMLVRQLLEGLEEEMFEACLLVPVPGVSDGGWVIDRLARQLGVESPPADRAGALAELYERLAIVREDGRSTVVILDEAQVLAEQGVLRDLRGLLNLEYEEKRLLTLVLVGLPALAQSVAAEPALADRVDLPLRLGTLRDDEAARYLTHRIRAAGGNPAILESGAVSALVKWAGGVPRRLNALADSALFEAHLAGRVSATAADVERAALELELAPAEPVAATPERIAPTPERIAPTPERIAPTPERIAPTPERIAPTAESMAKMARAVAPVPGSVAPPPVPQPSRAPARGKPAARMAPATAPAVVQRAQPAVRPAPAPATDLEAIFEETDETPLELEEVVAVGTDPVRAEAFPARDGEDSFGSGPFHLETSPDAAVALFGEARDLSDEGAVPLQPEDSAGDLDDLFADLVKE